MTDPSSTAHEVSGHELQALATSGSLPLKGIRVVDITVVWAGPHCTQLLAEWGAEVIRVEPRNRAQPSTRSVDRLTKDDVIRIRAAGQGALYSYPDFDPAGVPWNRTPAFNSHARNKLSMTGDIMSPEGLDILKRLVAVSDVLVENNAADTIEKARITYEELVKVNPRLIMLRMTAYGLSGPYKYYRSFGNHMESMTGQHYLRGYPDMDPSATGSSFTADAAGGVNGAFAVLMALRHRRRTGEGQLIELPLAETTLPYLGEIIMDYSVNGRMAEPNGNAHPLHSPHGAYPTAGEDRWIAIDVATDEEWQRLAALIAAPWTAEVGFASREGRITNRAAMDAHMCEWTKSFDAVELFQTLQAAGVTAGPVQDEGLAYDCPHLEERGFFVEITHPDAGTHRYPGMNIKMANTPNEVRRYPVRLGEDNDYVYREVIGVGEAEYDALKEKGQIGTDFLPSAYG